MILPLVLLALQGAAVEDGPMRLGDARLDCPALVAEATHLNAEAMSERMTEVHLSSSALRNGRMGSAAAGAVPLAGHVAGRAAMTAQAAAAMSRAESGSGVDAAEAPRARAELLLNIARLKNCAVPDDPQN